MPSLKRAHTISSHKVKVELPPSPSPCKAWTNAQVQSICRHGRLKSLKNNQSSSDAPQTLVANLAPRAASYVLATNVRVVLAAFHAIEALERTGEYALARFAFERHIPNVTARFGTADPELSAGRSSHPRGMPGRLTVGLFRCRITKAWLGCPALFDVRFKRHSRQIGYFFKAKCHTTSKEN
jgi:hypothetical protein